MIKKPIPNNISKRKPGIFISGSNLAVGKKTIYQNKKKSLVEFFLYQ